MTTAFDPFLNEFKSRLRIGVTTTATMPVNIGHTTYAVSGTAQLPQERCYFGARDRDESTVPNIFDENWLSRQTPEYRAAIWSGRAYAARSLAAQTQNAEEVRALMAKAAHYEGMARPS